MIHRADILGREVHVRWTDPKKKLWRRERTQGETVEGLTVTSESGKTKIYLHPANRIKGRQYAYIVGAHEWLHAMVEIPRKLRIRGYVKPILTHEQIYKLSVPFGSFLESIASAETERRHRRTLGRHGNRKLRGRKRRSS